MSDIKKIPFLLGDIGGTNIRLKLVNITESLNPEVEDVFAKDYRATPETIFDSIKLFIEECAKEYQVKPIYSVMGIPGVIINNTIIISSALPTLNNITGEKFSEMLGLKETAFLNDFNINGYAIQSEMLVEGKDYIQLNPSVPSIPNQTKAMIGPGTGLGMGYLTKQPDMKYYSVYSSEGGYTDFPPTDEIETRYKDFLRKKLGQYNVTVEDACSGRALGNLFIFFSEELKEENMKESDKKILNELRSNRSEKIVEINKIIVTEGVKPENKIEDSVCKKVVDAFVKIYASIAANYALNVLPYGGIYLLGGLSEGLLSYMREDEHFINKFILKGGLGVILKRIPIYVVVNLKFGVFGAEVYAKKIVIENLKKGKKE